MHIITKHKWEERRLKGLIYNGMLNLLAQGLQFRSNLSHQSVTYLQFAEIRGNNLFSQKAILLKIGMEQSSYELYCYQYSRVKEYQLCLSMKQNSAPQTYPRETLSYLRTRGQLQKQSSKNNEVNTTGDQNFQTTEGSLNCQIKKTKQNSVFLKMCFFILMENDFMYEKLPLIKQIPL